MYRIVSLQKWDSQKPCLFKTKVICDSKHAILILPVIDKIIFPCHLKPLSLPTLSNVEVNGREVSIFYCLTWTEPIVVFTLIFPAFRARLFNFIVKRLEFLFWHVGKWSSSVNDSFLCGSTQRDYFTFNHESIEISSPSFICIWSEPIDASFVLVFIAKRVTHDPLIPRAKQNWALSRTS